MLPSGNVRKTTLTELEIKPKVAHWRFCQNEYPSFNVIGKFGIECLPSRSIM